MRDLDLAQTFEDVAEDLLYTVAGLDADDLTEGMSKALSDTLDKVDGANNQHIKLLRDIVRTDAKVMRVRSQVETYCTDLQKTMLGVVNQDRKDARFLAYYPEAASTLIAADRDKLRKWLAGVTDLAAKEDNKVVIAVAKKAEALGAKWDAVDKARTTAENANSQHSAKVRIPLRHAVNDERKLVHAALVTIATKQKLGKRWPESFYRKAKAKKATPAEEHP